SGTYRLRIYASGDATNGYSFRLLDGAAAPVLGLDDLITGSITDPYGAVLYQAPLTGDLRLYFDQWTTVDYAGFYQLFDPFNNAVGSYAYLGSDLELRPSLNGSHLLLIQSQIHDSVPYAFQIIPGNH